jgi:hypothetical protein
VRTGPSERGIERQIVQAIRNSLNLPTLAVRARPSKARGVWLVRLVSGGRTTGWLELDMKAVAVAAAVGLLPPRLLGIFRLAYDSLKCAAPPGTR